jgi:hypothetical protein
MTYRLLSALLLAALTTTSCAQPSPAGSAAAPAPGSPESRGFPKHTAPKLTDRANVGKAVAAPEAWPKGIWARKQVNQSWEADASEKDLGLAFDGIDYVAGADEDGNGSKDYHLSADVAAGALGKHKVLAEGSDEDLMSDQPDVLRLSDSTANDTAVFAADQAFDGFTIAHGNATLAVEFTDDAIMVNGGAPVAEKDAAKAIVATEVGSSISPQSLAYLAGVLGRRAPAPSRGDIPQYVGSGVGDAGCPCYRVVSVSDPATQRARSLVLAVIKLRLGR